MSHIQFEIEELKAIATDVSHVLGFVSLSDEQTELRKGIVSKINEKVHEKERLYKRLYKRLYSNSEIKDANIKKLLAEFKKNGKELTMDVLTDMQFMGIIDKNYGKTN